MTGDEITLAVALVRATFLPGSYDKRFAAAMAAHASLDSEEPITVKQRLCLMQMAIRYRRQLPASVVELANKMMLGDCREETEHTGVVEAGNAGTCGNHINPLPLPG